MRTLTRTIHRGESNDPLPRVFNALPELWRGSVTMIAATPSAGKSFLTLKLVQAMGLPTLYFSADTQPGDQLPRAIAMVTGESQGDIRTGLWEGGADYYASVLAEPFGHVRWVFETDPSYDDIELELCAYAEVFGDFPQVVVIDNLVNVIGEGESDHLAQKETTKVLHRITRLTGAAVIVVHHMAERKADLSYPAPRSDLMNKVSAIPELILSMAGDKSQGLIRLAAVKDRNGPDDPSAQNFKELWVDFDRGQFFNTRHDREIGHAI